MSTLANGSGDIWTGWLLKKRFGCDLAQATRTIEFLTPIRDRILTNAALRQGDTLLDVGCGDGLIAFGALGREPSANAIFSDVSQELLDHARRLAEEASLISRCRFVPASADDLSPIPSDSVDAVTTRSVLIYVDAKQAAFREFYRVLKPGGRVSIFEPINRYGDEQLEDRFFGFDVAPVMESAAKLKALYYGRQPRESDPMFNFDERDLIEFAKHAMFRDIQMDLHIEIKHPENLSWETLMTAAPNPKIPAWGDAMEQVLTAAEKEAFIAHLRPQFEANEFAFPVAMAYLRAAKP